MENQSEQQQAQPPPYSEGASPPTVPVNSGIVKQPGAVEFGNNSAAPPGMPLMMAAGPSPPSMIYAAGQQQQPTAVVFVHAAELHFDKFPVQVQCPHCQYAVTTVVEQKPGMLPWLVCLGLSVFGCWLGCCLIPFCISDLQDCYHRCPNCKGLVGVHHRMN